MKIFDIHKYVRKSILNLKPYRSAREEYNGELHNMILLDANENPYDTIINRYPDPMQWELKTRLGRFRKVNPESIYLNPRQTMPLPPMITCVPTMCIMPNYEILKGGQILEYFAPMSKTIQDERKKLNMEPNAFSLDLETNGSFGVSSDSFSFWDTDTDELSAQGNGGMRQMYTYASIESTNNHSEQIYTPAEEADNNKQHVSLDKIQQQRNNEL